MPFVASGALLREPAPKAWSKSREVPFSHQNWMGNADSIWYSTGIGEGKSLGLQPCAQGGFLFETGGDGLLLLLYSHSSDVPNQGQAPPGTLPPLLSICAGMSHYPIIFAFSRVCYHQITSTQKAQLGLAAPTFGKSTFSTTLSIVPL